MLKRGQVFPLAGHRYKVQYVNASRAHCVCVDRRTVTVVDKRGQSRTFVGTIPRAIDISPDTQLEVLREFDSGARTAVFPRGSAR